jgi:hypothetical protein
MHLYRVIKRGFYSSYMNVKNATVSRGLPSSTIRHDFSELVVLVNKIQ